MKRDFIVISILTLVISGCVQIPTYSKKSDSSKNRDKALVEEAQVVKKPQTIKQTKIEQAVIKSETKPLAKVASPQNTVPLKPASVSPPVKSKETTLQGQKTDSKSIRAATPTVSLNTKKKVSTKPKVTTKPSVTTKPLVLNTHKSTPKLSSKITDEPAIAQNMPIVPDKLRTLVTKIDASVEETVSPDSLTTPQIALESLPLQFENWTLDHNTSLLDKKLSCVLNSASTTLEDGAGGTPFFLQVTSKAIVAFTKSNIDLQYPDTGMQIDLNPIVVVDRRLNETSAVFENKVNTLIEQFKQGQQATVTLGFWPSWPMSQSYQALIDLTAFPQAYQALLACNQI